MCVSRLSDGVGGVSLGSNHAYMIHLERYYWFEVNILRSIEVLSSQNALRFFFEQNPVVFGPT